MIEEVRWILTNNGDADLYIESITISWPDGNGKLNEIKRDGDTIHKGDFAYSPIPTTSIQAGRVTSRSARSSMARATR